MSQTPWLVELPDGDAAPSASASTDAPHAAAATTDRRTVARRPGGRTRTVQGVLAACSRQWVGLFAVTAVGMAAAAAVTATLPATFAASCLLRPQDHAVGRYRPTAATVQRQCRPLLPMIAGDVRAEDLPGGSAVRVTVTAADAQDAVDALQRTVNGYLEWADPAARRQSLRQAVAALAREARSMEDGVEATARRIVAARERLAASFDPRIDAKIALADEALERTDRDGKSPDGVSTVGLGADDGQADRLLDQRRRLAAAYSVRHPLVARIDRQVRLLRSRRATGRIRLAATADAGDAEVEPAGWDTAEAAAGLEPLRRRRDELADRRDRAAATRSQLAKAVAAHEDAKRQAGRSESRLAQAREDLETLQQGGAAGVAVDEGYGVHVRYAGRRHGFWLAGGALGAVLLGVATALLLDRRRVVAVG